MKVGHLILMAMPVIALGLAACGKPAGIPIQELKVEADDVALHVRIAGDPAAEDVLIAVNMGPGFSSHYMASLEQLAGGDFAVVTYDQRGTGRSSEPDDGYGLLSYVADLEAVREAVGAEKIHLFGHCWGRSVAMRYATIHPQRVRSMVLWGSASPSWQAVRAAQGNRALRMAALQKQGIIPENPSAFKEILPVFLSDPGFDLLAEMKNSQHNPNVEQETMAAVGEYDITAEVGRLDHPVLILWGKDDPFGLPTAEATRNALSAAQVDFALLESCGHFWQECPDGFFHHVRAFLRLPAVS
jgi:pimeloyl-ACP methyl ester carboxylesterase